MVFLSLPGTTTTTTSFGFLVGDAHHGAAQTEARAAERWEASLVVSWQSHQERQDGSLLILAGFHCHVRRILLLLLLTHLGCGLSVQENHDLGKWPGHSPLKLYVLLLQYRNMADN